jgi:hypothetical protein
MATSERNDQAISEILGTFHRKLCFNSDLDLDLLSSSVNVSIPPLKVPTEIVNDNNQRQGRAVSQHEGPQLDSSAVSISEHDLPHELVPPHGSVSTRYVTAPLEITGEPHAILSSAAPAGTREQSSQKGLLKGKTWFRFAFPPALTLRNRYFP